MIPHTPELLSPGARTPPENAKSPASRPRRSVAGGSAELACYQVGDPSTERVRVLLPLGLGEDADERLGAGGPDEHPPASLELVVDARDLGEQRLGKRAAPGAR